MTPIVLPHGELDLNTGEVRTPEQTHSLTDREVRLLSLLAATPGQPVTRQAIAEHLGVHNGLGPLLSDLLWRLRKKLEPDPKQPSVLLRHAGGSLIALWGTTDTRLIRLTDGQLNLSTHTVTRNDEQLSLSPLEWDIIKLLCAQKGTTLSLEDMSAQLKKGGPSSLRKAIARLREKLEVDPQKPAHLVTIYGKGVQFIPFGGAKSSLPAHAPLNTTPLFGRKTELHTLLEALASTSRILTLLGPGGSGKTRLARALAEEAAKSRDYPGGVVFCEWSDRATLLEGLGELAELLGSSLENANSVSHIIQRLGASLSGRATALIIIDNVEHLLPEARDVLSALFKLTHSTRFLLTSRKRLVVEAEQVVPLSPLPLRDGVDLFTHRARQLQQDTEGCEGEIEDLVGRLEGSPLAILIVASRLGRLGWEGLRSWTLSGLVSDEDALRQSIQWSLDLLTPAEASALAQCTVFRSGFDLELAEQVVSVPDQWAEDPLFGLLEHSLLWVSQDEDAPRLHLYESVRSMVMGPDPSVPDPLKQRYVGAFIQRSTQFFNASEEEQAQRTPNLERASSDWWLAQELARDIPLENRDKIVTVNNYLLQRQGRMLQWETMLKAWIPTEGLPLPFKNILKRNHMRCLFNLGLQEKAVQCARELLAPDSRLPEPIALNNAITAQATLMRLKQITPEQFCQWAREIAPDVDQALGDEAHQQAALNYYLYWAQSAWLMGDLSTAIEAFQKVQDHPVQDFFRKKHARIQQASCRIQSGEIELGLTTLQQAWQNARTTRAHYEICYLAILLGQFRLTTGQQEQAETVLAEGWDHINWNTPRDPNFRLGWIYAAACLANGHSDRARTVLESVITHCSQGSCTNLMPHILAMDAACAAMQGDAARFERRWAEAGELVTLWRTTPELIEVITDSYRWRATHPDATTAEHITERLRPHLNDLHTYPAEYTDPALHLAILGQMSGTSGS